MSATTKKSHVWFGVCPKKKKLRAGWEYVESADDFLKARSPDGTIFYVSPKRKTLIRLHQP